MCVLAIYKRNNICCFTCYWFLLYQNLPKSQHLCYFVMRYAYLLIILVQFPYLGIYYQFIILVYHITGLLTRSTSVSPRPNFEMASFKCHSSKNQKSFKKPPSNICPLEECRTARKYIQLQQQTLVNQLSSIEILGPLKDHFCKEFHHDLYCFYHAVISSIPYGFSKS